MKKDTDIRLRYGIPEKLTVEIDTREKRPLLFPASIKIEHPEFRGRALTINVITEKVKLEAGDYRLREYPNCCIIERKRGVREIEKNLIDVKDSVRQAKALRRLTGGCQYPILLIEFLPSEMGEAAGSPDFLLHKLAVVIAKYKLGLLWFPYKYWAASSRRHVGEFLIHLMLGYALRDKLEILPNLLDTD